MTVKFNHIGIRVKDIDVSAKFFQTILGDSAITIDIPGDESPDQKIKIVGKKGGVFFDLFTDGGAAPKNGPAYGMIHYCLGVDDVPIAYEAAINAGATEMTPPVVFDIEAPDGSVLKVNAAYVYDPNGDVCEFVDQDWIDRLSA